MFIFEEGTNPANGAYDVVDSGGGGITQQLTTVTISSESSELSVDQSVKKKSKHKSKHKSKTKGSPVEGVSSEPSEDYVLVD